MSNDLIAEWGGRCKKALRKLQSCIVEEMFYLYADMEGCVRDANYVLRKREREGVVSEEDKRIYEKLDDMYNMWGEICDVCDDTFKRTNEIFKGFKM